MQIHLPGKGFSLKSAGLLATFPPAARAANWVFSGQVEILSTFIFMIRVLLLGLGRWGVNHLRNLQAMPIQLYVAEVDSKRLEPARKLGLPETQLTTNYKECVDKVDCVIVVTPAQTHFPLCKEFLEASKDVFVEKPITLISDEAKKLTELAHRKDRILQVGHIFRFDPASQWLRDAIRAGQFGKVQILRSNFSGFKRPRNDSGVMFADAIHFVDLFNYFMEKKPARVFAANKDFMGRGLEDASLLSLEYENGGAMTWGTIETNYFLPGKFRDVTVIGSDLSAVCDYNVAQYKIKTFANRHVKEGNEYKALEGALHQIESPPEEPLQAELRAFIDSVQTRTAPRADGWAGYDSVRVLEAAIESAQTGRTVEVK
jgi:UDP-2-acetamido-3-amino-2,3-dideoxy-glucuronate N-acetyltransferase